jgi:diketogulonate reductase-like aldo/keto reductase
MRWIVWTSAIILIPWMTLGLTYAIADSMAARRHRELLEVRDWQEKVEAMRRLQDQEGDA